MTYSCSDFVDSIVEALGVTIPLDSSDSPSDQADICLAEIRRLQAFERAAKSDTPEADDGAEPRCTNPGGHVWAFTGTQYGGDDASYHGEGRSYCSHCGADGDA